MMISRKNLVFPAAVHNSMASPKETRNEVADKLCTRGSDEFTTALNLVDGEIEPNTREESVKLI